VRALAEILEPYAGAGIDLMVEAPQVIFRLPELVRETRGRCASVNFGPYDYTASLGITAAHQDVSHPACDFARSVMQASLAGTGVRLADGPTNTMPVPIHRGESLSDAQKAENRHAIHEAWRLHYGHVRRALAHGFYQSWDLHPAQLVTRYAAVYAFFLEGAAAASERLRNFMQKAAQATTVGQAFDDAATGQGLLSFFLRAINCGAVSEDQAPALTGLTLEELRTGSFAKILEMRH
jgi:hypothetical protein